MIDDPAHAAAFAAQLAALRAQFVQRLEGAMAAFGTQLDCAADQVPPAVLREVHAQLHRLAGTGGTFGYAELSRRARQLEAQAKEWLDAGVPGTGAEWEAWRTGVLGLRAWADRADDVPGTAPGQSA